MRRSMSGPTCREKVVPLLQGLWKHCPRCVYASAGQALGGMDQPAVLPEHVVEVSAARKVRICQRLNAAEL